MMKGSQPKAGKHVASVEDIKEMAAEHSPGPANLVLAGAQLHLMNKEGSVIGTQEELDSRCLEYLFVGTAKNKDAQMDSLGTNRKFGVDLDLPFLLGITPMLHEQALRGGRRATVPAACLTSRAAMRALVTATATKLNPLHCAAVQKFLCCPTLGNF